MAIFQVITVSTWRPHVVTPGNIVLQCKYFFHYGRCKFDDSCLYSHEVVTKDNQVCKAALEDLEVKVKFQEDSIQEHKNEIKDMKAQILHLEKENIEIKILTVV